MLIHKMHLEKVFIEKYNPVTNFHHYIFEEQGQLRKLNIFYIICLIK